MRLMVKLRRHQTEERRVSAGRKDVHALSYQRFPRRRKALERDLAGWQTGRSVMRVGVAWNWLCMLAGVAVMNVMPALMNRWRAFFTGARGVPGTWAVVFPLLMAVMMGDMSIGAIRWRVM